MKPVSLLSVRVQFEQDVVTARGRAKHLARLLGLSLQAQTRFATAVSELARNALTYGGGGSVEYLLDLREHQLAARVLDQGPGIAQLSEILAGQYVSSTGMGVGLTGTRRLMDTFVIDTGPGKGTEIRIAMHLPPGASPSTREVSSLVDALIRETPAGPLEEVRAQNQELLRTMAELSTREDQLQVLNRELEDTNRGVVALYSDLESKAELLREANHVKSMFLSYMSHEFRTPLNSILGLTRILLEQEDGRLTREQQKQVSLTQKAARELLEMVNDLLDVAKVEAGKTQVHVSSFAAAPLFSTLRALFHPLVSGSAVQLVFEDTAGLPGLHTDESKVTQILRNYIANALRCTAHGEVRVGAQLTASGSEMEFHVTDTGIGIATEDLGRLFQDFTQIGPPIRQGQGTGLGLSLARKLAELLAGRVDVSSSVGHGSRFSVTIPLVYPQAAAEQPVPSPVFQRRAGGDIPLVLLVDDSDTDRQLVGNLLREAGADVEEVNSAAVGLDLARSLAPNAAVMDLNMPGLSGLDLLQALRSQEDTRALPVLVVSAQVPDAELLDSLNALHAAFVPKQSLYAEGRDTLHQWVASLMQRDVGG